MSIWLNVWMAPLDQALDLAGEGTGSSIEGPGLEKPRLYFER
jgi:hypothetical protein